MNRMQSLRKGFIALLLMIFLSVLFCACGAGDSKGSEGDATSQSAASAAVSRGQTVRIATKNTAEQNILANLAKTLIEQKLGLNVELVYYEDSTAESLLKHLDDGDIDIFFDYTGTLATNALEMERDDINIATLLQDVQNAMKVRHKAIVSEKIGYNSSTSFYMMSDRREELVLTTLSDAAQKSSKLSIGMTEAFYNRADCYQALCETYGMEFKKAVAYQDEEKAFRDLSAGVIDIYVTDTVTPYASLFSVKSLNDDKYFFLPQYACYIISGKALDKHPELSQTLGHLDGLISAGRMSLMVKRINWEGNDITDYVYTYLRANNII